MQNLSRDRRLKLHIMEANLGIFYQKSEKDKKIQHKCRTLSRIVFIF